MTFNTSDPAATSLADTVPAHHAQLTRDEVIHIASALEITANQSPKAKLALGHSIPLAWLTRFAERVGAALHAKQATQHEASSLIERAEVVSRHGGLTVTRLHLTPQARQSLQTQARGLPGVPGVSEVEAAQGCQCETCRPMDLVGDPESVRMILCPVCGNKRCPHATHHINACTGSNEPGQPGSSWANIAPVRGPQAAAGAARAPSAAPTPVATPALAPVDLPPPDGFRFEYVTADGRTYSLTVKDEASARAAHFGGLSPEPIYYGRTVRELLSRLLRGNAAAGAPVPAPGETVLSCECGDQFPIDSYGAGFLEARGRCFGCDAAAQASLIPFEDARVQRVYDMLADSTPHLQGKPSQEHWEGWMARQIVAVLDAGIPPSPSADQATGQQSVE